jgi:hypothetical protein
LDGLPINRAIYGIPLRLNEDLIEGEWISVDAAVVTLVASLAKMICGVGSGAAVSFIST